WSSISLFYPPTLSQRRGCRPMGTPDITPFGRGAKPCCSHVPPNCHSPMGMEQAEVGHSPTCLPPRYRYGGFGYPPGIPQCAGIAPAQGSGILGGIPCAM